MIRIIRILKLNIADIDQLFIKHNKQNQQCNRAQVQSDHQEFSKLYSLCLNYMMKLKQGSKALAQVK